MQDQQDIRDAILLSTLPHVAFDGWTHKALEAGTRDAGFEPELRLRVFPGGLREVAEHFSEYADRRMLAALDGLDLDEMKVRDRVAAGVRARLEALTPHREAVRYVLAYLALPTNGGTVLRLTFNTLNAIWYAAGDTATDFNYYTKRGLLAPVYMSTVLYWLSDTSEGYADTWDFLDRRIGDVLKIPMMQARVKNLLKDFPRPYKGTGRSFGRPLRSRG
ncbi:MAG: COQ9 family protein [Rhodospirillales bacterium]|nr:COQ9 family protein [Rhodospirillales bacterium]